MIEIIEESYNRDEDSTTLKVRFSEGDRGIQFSISRNGRLTEQEMNEFAQQQFDEWKERTA